MFLAVLYLLFAIVFNSAASAFFKASAIKEPQKLLFLFSGLILGAINAIFYTKSLSKISLNIAYPIFSAGSIIFIAIISFAIFKETMNFKQIMGALLLLIGIFLISQK